MSAAAPTIVRTFRLSLEDDAVLTRLYQARQDRHLVDTVRHLLRDYGAAELAQLTGEGTTSGDAAP